MNETVRSKILCIEDEGDILDLLTIILGRAGFDCVTALGGIEGIQKAHTARPDLIMLDLMMPDMGGWEVLRHLQEDDLLKNIPVIILTVKDLYFDANIPDQAGHEAAFMTKPFECSKLIQCIRDVLEQASATEG